MNNSAIAVVGTSTCVGDKGCGQTFPSNEPGADFRFSQLCATCYKKSSTSSLLPSNSNEKSKRGRKPKKRCEDDATSEDMTSSVPEPAVQHPAVIGSIGHFFQRFSEKYPSGTSQYTSFVKLTRVRQQQYM